MLSRKPTSSVWEVVGLHEKVVLRFTHTKSYPLKTDMTMEAVFGGGGYIYKFHGLMDAFILLVDEEIPTFSVCPGKGRTLGLKRRVIWATELATPEGERMSLFGCSLYH